MTKNVLIIIPARGGSKGIPRKNLRPLCGKPLLHYACKTALTSKYKPTVYVSSEDIEILELAEKLGAKTHNRSKSNAQDHITLDPVIFEAVTYAERFERKLFDIVITLQPTSPLLKSKTLDNAIQSFIQNRFDTLISGINDTHLTWTRTESGFIANYKKRVNRQQLPQVFKETGSFLISNRQSISEKTRIGKEVSIYEIPKNESVDVDDFEDWKLCEYYLLRKKVLFVVDGNLEIGLGHVYNTLALAHNILDHEVEFLVGKNSELAMKLIQDSNYKVSIQVSTDLVDDIIKCKPHVVINDRLDSEIDYIKNIKSAGIKTISFEDLGEGAKYADIVINAIYPEKEILPNHYFGQKYFVLREEFLLSQSKVIDPKVSKVLLSFGGVDPNNLTEKVLSSIYVHCKEQNISVDVILGKGYKNADSLLPYKEINLYKNINNISEYMRNADIAFTSAGRTTFEIAAVGTPCIVMSQNERETTHFFASEQYGFLNLGLGSEVSKDEILKVFTNLAGNYEARVRMNELLLSTELRKGKKRVLDLINKAINEAN